MTDTFYINSDSFLTATSIYTDANLTVFAADGFYKDCGVVRYLEGGVLGDVVACPTCSADCDAIYTLPNQGVYTTTVDLGAQTGIASVLFNPGVHPAAIYVTYNGTVYSSVVLSNGDVLEGPYYGASANDCGLVANSPHLFTAYTYNAYEAAYEVSGTSQVSITTDELSLTPADPGTLYIVFAYNDSSVSQATITVVNACKDSSSSFTVNCGSRVLAVDSTSRQADASAACSAAINTRVYLGPRDNVSTTPSVGDKIFLDARARVLVEDGFYGFDEASVKKSMEVVNGGVVSVTTCAAP